MSVWTHVAGIVRFDDIRIINAKLDWLGEPVRWEDDDEEKWRNCILPCGSEGSLEYQIYENPDPCCVARWCVQFWGDLRDYDDEEEIIDYFKKITKDKWVRQGVFTIHVEFYRTRTFVYDVDKKDWIELNKIGENRNG